MSEFNTLNDALDFLARLGSSAAIADEFERRNIHSVPGCPESCAIADFLRVSLGADSVTVDGSYTFVRYPNESVVGGNLPTCAQEFVVDFDCGKYINLISKYPAGPSTFELAFTKEEAA